MCLLVELPTTAAAEAPVVVAAAHGDESNCDLLLLVSQLAGRPCFLVFSVTIDKDTVCSRRIFPIALSQRARVSSRRAEGTADALLTSRRSCVSLACESCVCMRKRAWSLSLRAYVAVSPLLFVRLAVCFRPSSANNARSVAGIARNSLAVWLAVKPALRARFCVGAIFFSRRYILVMAYPFIFDASQTFGGAQFRYIRDIRGIFHRGIFCFKGIYPSSR